MKAPKRLKASRGAGRPRLRPIPPKLQPILELLDLIPTDAELIDLSKRFRYLLRAKRISEERKHIAAHQVVVSCLEALPRDFRRHVWLGGKKHPKHTLELIDKFFINASPENSRARILKEVLNNDGDVLDDIYYGFIEDAVREYSFIRDARQKLRRIIELASPTHNWLSFIMTPVETSGTIKVNDNGVVEVSNDRFAEAVLGVDATLIRECAICKRIFWAGRRDKHCCSTGCAHALRNRRYRERYRQGLYQGARLTEKERKAVLQAG